MSELTDRGKEFRLTITAFIEGRRETKLKGDADDLQKASRYGYSTWLTDAASRAHNLRVVTHPIKFTHGAIKGASSGTFNPRCQTLHHEIGTHSAGAIKEDFAINDSKHLDIYSFLKEVACGKPLLEWLRDNDQDFISALSDDPAKANLLAEGFRSVLRDESEVRSHTLAKQVYWLTGERAIDDLQYHLLQPLFSSSLEHAVHADVRSVREAAFAARGTKKKKGTLTNHATYPNIVERTFGGSNAQNVSPINKARGGVSHLFASLPPRWDREHPRNLLDLDCAIEQRFAYFEGVRPLVRKLSEFLQSVADQPRNKHIVERRETIEQAIGFQLPMFAASIQARLEPGWTRDPGCTLPLFQQLWLDPERVELDPRLDPAHPEWEQQDRDFIAAYDLGDWQDQVASRFAQWLNAQLRDAGLTGVGDAEYAHWARRAIVDAAWPVPLQRRASAGGTA